MNLVDERSTHFYLQPLWARSPGPVICVVCKALCWLKAWPGWSDFIQLLVTFCPCCKLSPQRLADCYAGSLSSVTAFFQFLPTQAVLLQGSSLLQSHRRDIPEQESMVARWKLTRYAESQRNGNFLQRLIPKKEIHKDRDNGSQLRVFPPHCCKRTLYLLH